jgi:hypothetical protein
MAPTHHDSDAKHRLLMEHYNLLLRHQDEHEDEFGPDEEDDYGLGDQIKDLGTDPSILRSQC